MATANMMPTAADELAPLNQIADAVGIPYSTALGWSRTGVKGTTLKVFKRGRRIYTRPSWFSAFVRATQ
jgi:hypothetical protein